MMDPNSLVTAIQFAEEMEKTRDTIGFGIFIIVFMLIVFSGKK